MQDKTIIKNCFLYNDKNNCVDVVLVNDRIAEIKNADNEIEEAFVVDAKGRQIIPGLIDIHIQGAGGADILDNSEEALITIAQTLARTGTTSYLGTTVVKPKENNTHLKLAQKFYKKKIEGAELIGIHLEGPFINEIKKGGLDPSSIYAYDMYGGIEGVFEATDDSLKMMTIAPELEGHHEIIRKLRAKNVIAAFAHSNADYIQTVEGFEAGINHVTHLFNAMCPINHREPGPIPAIFERKDITVQLISDGHHLHPAIINFVYSSIGIDRCICITDGMPGIGLPEGKYIYNGKDYISKDGAAKYLDGTLIGSTMSLLNIAFKFMEFTKCSFEDAIKTVTVNPAKLLGLENKKGCIKAGADADIVILDNDHSVSSTIIGGKVIYSK